MIKFVLHGGHTSKANMDNSGFYREMTADQKGKLKILLNYFARKEEDIERLSRQDIQKFKKYSANKNIEFKIAKSDNLESQLKWADVMYMRGGWTEWLTKKLSKTPNLEKSFDDKVIGGSSAGVYTLVKYYYGNDSKRIGKGLGILSMKAYCHYETKDKAIVKKLSSYKEKLPLLILPIYKWVVIYK